MERVALPADTLLDRKYRVESIIAAGGFGITYLARHRDIAQIQYAVKEYFPEDFAYRDGEMTVRARASTRGSEFQWGLRTFLDEAKTVAQFKHKNIVKVIDYFEENGTAYAALEYIDGQSLAGWLRSLGRPPTQDELDRITLPLLDALELLHASHYLHRDIAPDNILLRSDGSPVLIDFGAARRAMGERSRDVSAIVKQGYSPGEQYTVDPKSQGPWTDIYALAATLYLAMTGERPTDAPGRQIDDSMVPVATAARTSYRPGFIQGVQWGLAVHPRDRPRSIADWRAALTQAQPARTTSASTSATTTTGASGLGIAADVLLAVLGVAGVLTLVLSGGHDSRLGLAGGLTFLLAAIVALAKDALPLLLSGAADMSSAASAVKSRAAVVLGLFWIPPLLTAALSLPLLLLGIALARAPQRWHDAALAVIGVAHLALAAILGIVNRGSLGVFPVAAVLAMAILGALTLMLALVGPHRREAGAGGVEAR